MFKGGPFEDQAWFPPQQELLEAGFFESDEHWLVCAPTGSGKTLIGELAILGSLQRSRQAVYLAPLKAIVEERLEAWQGRFAEWSIGLFTGDCSNPKAGRSPADHDILLFTPEKLASYLHNWKSNLRWLSRVGSLVVDEIHLIGDSGRGAGLECLLARWKRINPFTRIVGLTGTLANAEEIASWMGARLYRTNWQPIPVEHRIVRFSKAEQKLDLLCGEITTTLNDGGRALVFTNSRRRCERLCEELKAAGIQSAFTHAGLAPHKRMEAHAQLREAKVDVLVTTSGLEMGVNFPARKVVIYDSYGFDGEKFGPMPVSRYLQASGRAGRAGLDPYGESVLFLPKWAGADPDYAARIPEPVVSGLFQDRRRVFEVLSDVGGRLSLSEEHLTVNFANRSLWLSQGGYADLSHLVESLVEGGFLRRDQNTGKYLSDTALGRIACQMAIEPASISSFVRFFDLVPDPTIFDVLLMVCWTGECTPKLGFNFEEVDAMSDTLLAVPSRILDMSVSETLTLQGNADRRTFLAGIKSAVLLHQHTQGEDLNALALQYDAYPYDLELLRQNACRVLATAQRVFGVLWAQRQEQLEEKDHEKSAPAPKCRTQCICEDLHAMVEHGIPCRAVNLVRIDGIGSKRAKRLITHGIETPAQLAGANIADICQILRLKEPSARQLLTKARQVAAELNADDPFSLEEEVPETMPPTEGRFDWPPGIDPYRLRRALELQVDHLSEDTVRVSGGAEPHRVTISRNTRSIRRYACDCADHRKGHAQCKHVLRAKLELGDDNELMSCLRMLETKNKDTSALRYSLGDIWMDIADLYDRYNGREIDYSGQRFLRKARRTMMR